MLSAHDETKRAGEERKLLVDRVRAAARSGHGEALGAVLSEVAPADLAEMLDLFDEDARTAIINSLSRIVPMHGGYHHREGNSAAHIKACLTGNSSTLIVESGRVKLGTWQGIFFAEFDGPRNREVWVHVA